MGELDSRKINDSQQFLPADRCRPLEESFEASGAGSFWTIAEYQAVDLTLNYKSLSRGAPRESEFQETCLIVLQLRARVVRSQGYPCTKRAAS